MKKIQIGSSVTYVPGENDHGARPRNTPMPAVVTSSSEIEVPEEFEKKDGAFIARGGKKKTITVYNLNVHQDTGLQRRTSVKHENDAAEGEPHIVEAKGAKK